ncbi:hypothetical protein ACM614_17455, partial [Streptomyces sp. 12297]
PPSSPRTSRNPMPGWAARVASSTGWRRSICCRVLAALHRPVEEEDEQAHPAPGSDPVVLASGNLGLVSFPDVPHRLTRQQIERRHPVLLATLAAHPGIGFLLVRGDDGGSLVLGPDGAEARLDVPGEAEALLAAYGPGAADAVRRTDGFPHVADIMVNSAYDPGSGSVHAFEEQIGSHGGLGGEQGHAFLMWPSVLSEPPGPVNGAEQVHTLLRGWLAEAEATDGPADGATDGAADGVPREDRLQEHPPAGTLPSA